MYEVTSARRHYWLKRAAFSVAILVVTVAVIEAVVRIFLPPIDWPSVQKRLLSGAYSRWDSGYVLTYVYNPDYNFRLAPKVLPVPVPITINDLGLKGPMPQLVKSPGSVRIIVLGGSSSFLFSSQTGQNWPDILAAKLTQRTGRPIEVINAATPGYTSYQSSMRLQTELIAYSPDIVIVDHLWNDIKLFALDDPRALIHEWEALSPKQGSFSALTHQPILDGLANVSQTVAQIRFRAIRGHLDRAVSIQEGRVHKSTHETIKPAGPEFYQENLERMITTLAPARTPLVIVEQPTLVHSDNTDDERQKINYKYTGLDHPTLVKAYKEGWDINERLCKDPKVFCFPAHTAIPPTLEFFKDQVHFTGEGREALAEFVNQSLEKTFQDFQNLIDRSDQEQNH